jgi:hypothetical protein
LIYPPPILAKRAEAGQLDLRREVVGVTTEGKVAILMNEIVEVVRRECFRPEYQTKATEEECVGIAVSKYFAWDTRIFLAFYEALEDANFHTAADEVRTLAERVNEQYSKSYFKK